MSASKCTFFFFNDTATTEIYTLSLHDALPIFGRAFSAPFPPSRRKDRLNQINRAAPRSEEHTSELQSRPHLVCRLLLEKKKTATSGPAPRACSTTRPRATTSRSCPTQTTGTSN